jgi:tripartite ATP-independent transporter DctP family solute receptor
MRFSKYKKSSLALAVALLAFTTSSCEKLGDSKKNKAVASNSEVSKSTLASNDISSKNAKHTIKVVFLGNTDDEDYDGSLVFKDFVESRSNGEVAVKIFPGGQLCGKTEECIQALQTGVIEVFMTTLGGFSNFFPEIQVLDLPYMFDNDREVEQVYAGPFVNELREAIIKKTGVRLMTITNTGGWRNIANTKKQIRTPSDMKGLKLRTINSEVQIELVKSLGANPTPISWPELYTSLATGVVDGSKNGITDIVGMKFHEHIKHITLDGHAYMSAMWVMNNKAFEKLSYDHKRIVVDGFENLRNVTTALPKRRQIEAYEEFKQAGGKIYVPTPEEKAQFVKAAEPIYDWYSKKFGRKWLDKLQAAIKQARKDLEIAYQFKEKNRM